MIDFRFRSDLTSPIALIERINSDSPFPQSKHENESGKWITTSLSIKGSHFFHIYFFSC